MKKWTLHVAHRLFKRYGDPRGLAAGSPERAFADLWKRHCSGAFLQAQLELLALVPAVRRALQNSKPFKDLTLASSHSGGPGCRASTRHRPRGLLQAAGPSARRACVLAPAGAPLRRRIVQQAQLERRVPVLLGGARASRESGRGRHITRHAHGAGAVHVAVQQGAQQHQAPHTGSGALCAAAQQKPPAASASAPAQGQYVSPRVMNLALQSVTDAIALASTWKLLRPAVGELLTNIVFPAMCFDDEDAELWRDDPQEYIRKARRSPGPGSICCFSRLFSWVLARFLCSMPDTDACLVCFAQSPCLPVTRLTVTPYFVYCLL